MLSRLSYGDYGENDLRRIKDWFNNGKKLLETYVRDGEFRGRYLLFSETGELLLEGEWYLGRPDGLTRVYFRNGKVRQEVQFRKGRLHGFWKEWDEAGNRVAEGRFRNGCRLEWRIFGLS